MEHAGSHAAHHAAAAQAAQAPLARVHGPPRAAAQSPAAAAGGPAGMPVPRCCHEPCLLEQPDELGMQGDGEGRAHEAPDRHALQERLAAVDHSLTLLALDWGAEVRRMDLCCAAEEGPSCAYTCLMPPADCMLAYIVLKQQASLMRQPLMHASVQIWDRTLTPTQAAVVAVRCAPHPVCYVTLGLAIVSCQS